MLCDKVFVECVVNMECGNIEQQYAIKFYVKHCDSAKGKYDKLIEVFDDDALSHAQGVFRYHGKFRNDGESVTDEP